MRISIKSKGKIIAYTSLDVDDYKKQHVFNWYLSGMGYACRQTFKHGAIYLHKEILSSPGFVTDHINGNKLDNRKSNLRICTKLENHRNMKISKRNKSGYKGVSWDKSIKGWRLRFVCLGKSIMSRKFNSKMEAAKMYNTLAKRYFGQYANLNKV